MGTYGREAAIEEMLPLEQPLQDGLQSAKEQIDAALAANRKEKDAEIQKLDRYANQRVRSFNELSKEAEAKSGKNERILEKLKAYRDRPDGREEQLRENISAAERSRSEQLHRESALKFIQTPSYNGLFCNF